MNTYYVWTSIPKTQIAVLRECDSNEIIGMMYYEFSDPNSPATSMTTPVRAFAMHEGEYVWLGNAENPVKAKAAIDAIVRNNYRRPAHPPVVYLN